ncbi:unnamed protein product [Brassica oleracea]
MKDVGIEPSVIHFTTLIDGLSRAGNLEACKYSHEMVDVVCYTLMITGQGNMSGFTGSSLAFVSVMVYSVLSIWFYSVLSLCDVVDERRWISSVVERGVLEVDVTLRPRWRGPVHTDEVHGNCFLPYHLFRSKTLVKLRLGTDTIVGKLPPDGLDSYTGDVTIGLFQVKELHVVGYRGTAKELQHLKSLLAGTECIPKMQVEFPQDVVVDDAKMIQTRRDLFILVGVVSTDVAYFE